MNASMLQDGRVSLEGDVRLPKRVQARLGLEPGAKVVFRINEAGEVVLHRDRAAPQPMAPAPAARA
ncbi:MAG: hypothetical protein AB7L65_11500 [Hyphomonadaceae bacterium]